MVLIINSIGMCSKWLIMTGRRQALRMRSQLMGNINFFFFSWNPIAKSLESARWLLTVNYCKFLRQRVMSCRQCFWNFGLMLVCGAEVIDVLPLSSCHCSAWGTLQSTWGISSETGAVLPLYLASWNNQKLNHGPDFEAAIKQWLRRTGM